MGTLQTEALSEIDFEKISPDERLDLLSQTLHGTAFSKWNQINFVTGSKEYLVVADKEVDILEKGIKFHITPQPNQILEVTRDLSNILEEIDPENRLPFCFKVATGSAAYKIEQEDITKNPPRIVVYPNYRGRYDLSDKITAAANVYKLLYEKINQYPKDEDYIPRFTLDVAVDSKPSIIGIAQGSGAHKYLNPDYRQDYPEELGFVLDMEMFREGALDDFEVHLRKLSQDRGRESVKFSYHDSRQQKRRPLDSVATGRMKEVEPQFFCIRDSSINIITASEDPHPNLETITDNLRYIALSSEDLPAGTYYEITRMISNRIQDVLNALSTFGVPAPNTEDTGEQFLISLSMLSKQRVTPIRELAILLLTDPFFEEQYEKRKDLILDIARNIHNRLTETYKTETPSMYSLSLPDSCIPFYEKIRTDL